MVTEGPNGALSADGNRATSVKAKGRLTARLASRAGTKVGLNDPAIEGGIVVAQRIIGTLGITGLSGPRVHIDDPVWHLNIQGWRRSNAALASAYNGETLPRAELVRTGNTVGSPCD